MVQWAIGFVFLACAIGDGISQVALGVLGGVVVLSRTRVRVSWFGVAFVVWCLFTAAVSRYGWPRGSELARLFNLLPLVVFPQLDEVRPTVFVPMIAALVLASIFAWFQYRYGVTWGAALSGAAEARWAQLVPGTMDRYFAGGFFFHRLKFSHALVIGILVTALSQRGRWRYAAVAVMVVGLWLTFARAAIVAVVAGALVAGGAVWVAAAALPLALLPQVAARIASIASSESYLDRQFLWARALEIIHDHPWLGTGFGHYSRVCHAYYDKVDPSFVMRTHAHNQFLTTLAETGPVGLALLCAAIYRKNAYFAAIAVVCLVHDPFIAHAPTAILYSMMLALSQSGNQSRKLLNCSSTGNPCARQN